MKDKIARKFADLKSAGRKGFIAYICAGDPSVARTKQLILEFEKVGVDVVELGVPFSDPIADGVVNQRAAERALRNHVSLADVISLIQDVRKKSEIPIVLFTYVNPVLKYGVKAFCRDLATAGGDGALTLDYPPEESGEYKKLMDAHGLATIGLVAPTTPDERLERILDFCSGFVYYVSRTGVTGVRKDVDQSVSGMVKKIKSLTKKPVAVGFGISNPQQARTVAGVADAVVVGSAIVQKIEQSGSSNKMVDEVSRFTGELVAAVKRVRLRSGR
ncbi:MAG: tryptophan synthase subunit alpha [bacterium]|nr:tryptophan synthase subunit alpha [bacterium]